jgi:hypothetical protein
MDAEPVAIHFAVFNGSGSGGVRLRGRRRIYALDPHRASAPLALLHVLLLVLTF